ncbi:SpoIIE family protein phosphatase [Amycolatopsis sp. K13G38]|uniref:histidine kinase n=1 Tax=Amycolatopsis acididurans TaxID=2724524 RepID=A0ABX1JDX7_9PSEU|nr:SpoIIE family protein phosphatase [Amycolatopsis acididurans]NKQ57948.1 SpoIIE family protein phosphatase [Amycolatopsis acididurans]
MREDLPEDLAAAIKLGGEMGRRIAEFDWDTHELGPLARWPPPRRTALALALTSPLPIGLFLFADRTLLLYNDAYIVLLGEKHPAALGRSGGEVWWEQWHTIEATMEGLFATGEATQFDNVLYTLTDHGRFCHRYFTVSFSPIVTAGGVVDGVVVVAHETTATVLGQRRLDILNTLAAALMGTRTVADAVRALIGACADQTLDLPFTAVYLEDPATHTAVLRGVTPSAQGLLPATLDELLPPTDGTVPESRRVTDLGQRVPGLAARLDDLTPEQALVIPVGEASAAGALVLGLSPRQHPDERYLGFCRLLADQLNAAFTTAGSYEEQRRRADALAELDRAKTAFLANISHEFRTPLTLLLGPVEEAIAAARGRPAQLARLEIVRRNAQRLLRLVNSLLEFSRTEAGRATANLVRADVGALTAQIASSFTELCRKAGIELVLACRSVFAAVDPQMWETIVLNLLSNAVKFTLSGSITVEVGPEGDGRVRVAVRDTGTGIAPEELPRLFDRFYRADNTRGRTVEGSGIGLSLVRGLVELHGGTIDIDSEFGQGTTVTVRLPAVPAGPVAETAAVTGENPYLAEVRQWLDDPAASARTGRRLVLIADDNADMRRHLERILSARWDTVVYGDGESALRGLREHRPDVVVTDVMMPVLDGFELVEAIRADPAVASTPVLMLSARAGVEAAGEGLASGADDYLPKPFSSADLVNRVAARLTAADRERISREQEETEAARATALARCGSALGAARSVPDILAALVATPVLAPDSAAIGLVDRAHARIRVDHAGGGHAETRERDHTVPLDASAPMAKVIRSGQPLIITDAGQAGAGIRTEAAYPIRDETGAMLGAISLHWAEPRALNPPELELLARIAELAGPAVERMLAAERERRIAADFQEQLLDLDRSSADAVVAAVYQPATKSMRVGGDWYLVTPIGESGRIALSVGDVVGHGLAAATVMSRLRSAIGAAALTITSPSAVLEFTERYAADVPRATCATVAYAVLAPAAHTISYACAGHPYPLLVTPDEVRYLEQGRHPPLAAANFHTSSPVGQAELPPGSLVVLYTDGLIERAGESISDGFDRLAAAARDLWRLPVHEVCAELLSRLAPPGGYNDDVAILAVRPSGAAPRSFVASLPAEVTELPSLRGRLSAWLPTVEPSEQKRYDIVASVGEAVGNAIEHGSGPGRETVFVEVFADADTISATVSDTGRWPADSASGARRRGRGLTIMKGLAEHVDIAPTPRGTHVTLRFRRG